MANSIRSAHAGLRLCPAGAGLRGRTSGTGFEALSRYAKREGYARPPRAYREGEFHLGNWVSRQQTAHAAGKLSPERARRLVALPGWSWDERKRRTWRGGRASRGS
jgi:hypothetical protein